MTIGVIGTGYLGATHAACLAELGFHVLAHDVDEAKVAALAAGELPFFEPGLDELVRRHTTTGRLRFVSEVAALAEDADLHFVCVGTPQRRDGMAADTSQVFGAVEALVPHLRRHTLIVGKSTVPVGTSALLAERVAALAPEDIDVEVAWNPEFLREGHAVQDTLHPDRLVFGVGSPEAEKGLRQVYDAVIRDGAPVLVTDLPTAELVKVAANAFLATKISFANAMAELCDASGADVVTLADALGLDPRIGRRFLNAGLGFGGGCLPKDIRALMARAGELGAGDAFSLLRVVDSVNMHQRNRTVDLATEMCGGSVLGSRIAVLGAAFKPDTDDVRDSPALNVAAQLQLRGGSVVVYDPRAGANAARLFPTLSYAESALDAVRGADLVMLLTEWEEFVRLDPAVVRDQVATPAVLDTRNALDGAAWRRAGWRFRSFGRV
ncbi:MAG: UDP-glucose/GDP-mannose dehydrogenase family protein [Nocardioidaceae bacterium]|nr:UDP-glucose/GDP-mannose dehydrogenase family protein [Nocardioidaceae bacterium]NUS50446.1 UDP-glucose/GDP-mannose dehydrogenase family protein [Nocardioidaceae bacterium]